MQVDVTINGESRSADVEPRTLLVDFIRTHLGLTGTHIGCDTTSCGACTVILDGKPVKSCTILAVQAHGSEMRTVEGLRQNGNLHPIQVAFKEHHGLQCGFCTPGMMLVGRHCWRGTRHPRRRRSAGRSAEISAAAPGI